MGFEPKKEVYLMDNNLNPQPVAFPAAILIGRIGAWALGGFAFGAGTQVGRGAINGVSTTLNMAVGAGLVGAAVYGATKLAKRKDKS